jgi:hypothetical protein
LNLTPGEFLASQFLLFSRQVLFYLQDKSKGKKCKMARRRQKTTGPGKGETLKGEAAKGQRPLGGGASVLPSKADGGGRVGVTGFGRALGNLGGGSVSSRSSRLAVRPSRLPVQCH